MRSAFRTLIPLALLALLAGCGQQEQTTAPPAVPPPSGAPPAGAPPAKTENSVVIISPALTSVFHQELVKGAEDQWVPLDPELWEVLQKLPRHGKKVFRFVASDGQIRSARLEAALAHLRQSNERVRVASDMQLARLILTL